MDNYKGIYTLELGRPNLIPEKKEKNFSFGFKKTAKKGIYKYEGGQDR